MSTRVLTVHRLLGRVAFCAVLCWAWPGAAAGYGLFSESGRGSAVDLFRLGAQWNWEPQDWLPRGDHYEVVGFWEGSYGHWHGQDNSPKSVTELDEVGFKAVLRAVYTGGPTRPYVEWGPGFRLMSHTRINSNRVFSTAFQFDNHIGVGVEFGPNGAYDIGYRFRHISNAAIKHPNNGINLQEVQLTYHWR